MKALLTNHSLAGVGGTEKWVWTMALELKRRGWEVECYCLVNGEAGAGAHLAETGVPVLTAPPDKAYDLILVNHNTCLALLEKARGLRIFTSHGASNPLEFPVRGADAYVGVTPEVADSHHKLGFDLTVITNGLDLSEFRPRPCSWRAKHDLPMVLCMCKSLDATEMVEEACRANHYPLAALHYLRNPMWDVGEHMGRFDIVIGCGRTAYEGLASGCSVMVFDRRDRRVPPQGDGWLTAENIDACFARNCAGRTNKLEWSVDDLARELREWQVSPWGRPWAEEHCDVRQKVDQYLKLANLSEEAR